MTELIAIRLEDGSEIYMEATENVVVSEGPRAEPQPETETTRTAKGLTWGTAQSPAESAKALNVSRPWRVRFGPIPTVR
jgi:hypothetical protein